MVEKGFITLSVDDGYPLDMRVAGLLKKYSLPTTFYIPATDPSRPVLEKSEIRELSEEKLFEIGAHTYSHVPIHRMTSKEAKNEIVEGKTYLEDLTGKQVSSFCYPHGKFTADTIRLVKEAGFKGARTCHFNILSPPKDPFLTGVSTHAYSHSAGIQIRHAIVERNIEGLKNYLSIYRMKTDWEIHFMCSLDYVERNGGVAHLYFHSWEIEKEDQWEKLERVLCYAAQKTSLKRILNKELYDFSHIQNQNESYA